MALSLSPYPTSSLTPFCVPTSQPHIVARYNYSIDHEQGRTEKLKRGGGKTEGGRILRKINCFCEILNKMFQKGGTAPPLCTSMTMKGWGKVTVG